MCCQTPLGMEASWSYEKSTPTIPNGSIYRRRNIQRHRKMQNAKCLADFSENKFVTTNSLISRQPSAQFLPFVLTYAIFWESETLDCPTEDMANCFWAAVQCSKSHYQSQFVFPRGQFFHKSRRKVLRKFCCLLVLIIKQNKKPIKHFYLKADSQMNVSTQNCWIMVMWSNTSHLTSIAS
jgi:hypothetical protein